MQRQPHVHRAEPQPVEAFRRDADDGVSHAADEERLAEHVGRSPHRVLPISVADDARRLRYSLDVLGLEIKAAEVRTNTEHGKIGCRRERRRGPACVGSATNAQREIDPARDPRERRRALVERGVVETRQPVDDVRAVAAESAKHESHDTIGIGDAGRRAKKEMVGETQHRNAESDAEAEGQNDAEREAPASPERAKGVPEVEAEWHDQSDRRTRVFVAGVATFSSHRPTERV